MAAANAAGAQQPGSADQQQPRFVTWLEAQGGQVHPGLSLFAALPGGDRGIVARGAVSKGDVLLRVPAAACLHLPTPSERAAGQAPTSAAAEHLLAWRPALSPFLATVLLLLHEQAQGAASRYAGHLAVLPREHNCVLGWTPEQKAYLTGTAAEQGGESAHEVFDATAQPVIAAAPHLWPGEWGSAAAFVCAAGLVQSRAFHLEKANWLLGSAEEGSDLYLMPGIDMVNHSSDAALRNTSLTQEGAGPDLCFVMRAERDIPAGQQVLHTYGDLGDAQLLVTYGFCDPLPDEAPSPDQAPSGAAPAEDRPSKRMRGGEVASGSAGAATPGHADAAAAAGGGVPRANPHNSVQLPLDLVVEVCRPEGKMDEARASWLKNLVPSGLFDVTAGAPLPDSLLTVALALHMTGSEWEGYAAETARGAPLALDAGYVACLELGDNVIGALLRVLARALQRYPVLPDLAISAPAAAGGRGSARAAEAAEVEALRRAGTAGPGFDARLRDALRVRVGERRLLRAAQAAVLALAAQVEELAASEEGDSDSNEDSDGEESDSQESQSQ